MRQTGTEPHQTPALGQRLKCLRARRLAEDERLVCMARARILHDTFARHAGLSRLRRQSAILRDLCEQIPVIVEPEDAIVGRMPEIIPAAEEERFAAEHPELASLKIVEEGCDPDLPLHHDVPVSPVR